VLEPSRGFGDVEIKRAHMSRFLHEGVHLCEWACVEICIIVCVCVFVRERVCIYVFVKFLLCHECERASYSSTPHQARPQKVTNKYTELPCPQASQMPIQ
jgi:hypothetical protein